MNSPAVDARTMFRIEVRAARRAHHCYLRLKTAGVIPALHAQLLRDVALWRAQALATRIAGEHKHSLARANGCDQPVSARGLRPTTPAAQERVCHVVAVGARQRAGDDSARGTVQRSTRGAIV